MTEQEKPMQVYFGTKGNNGEWIPHFVEIRELKSKFNRKAEWRKPREYPAKFKRFDEHRDSILSEMKKVLEKWFTEGVTFEPDQHSSPLAYISPVPLYDNAPPKLNETIVLAQGAIIWDILTFKKIPLWMRTEVIQVGSAVKEPGSDKGKDWWEAEFGNKVQWFLLLLLGPVYDTEKDMKYQPRKRAEIIANYWYESTVPRTLNFIEQAYKKLSEEDAAETRFGVIEAYIYTEQRLKAMGKVDLQIMEFFDCIRGYKYSEIAEIQRKCGRNIKPTAIRENHIETAKALRLNEGQQNEIRTRQNDFRRLLTKLSSKGF